MKRKTQRTALTILKDTNLDPEAVWDDPDLQKVEARFHELQSQAFRDLVEASVELGQLLERGRKIVGPRSFAPWLDRLHIGRASAYNFLAAAELARKHPNVIQRWKELGPSKIYQLARLPDGQHGEVLQRSRREELLAMNDREFTEMIRPYLPKSQVPVTPARKAHGLRQKAASWRTQLTEFRTYFRKHRVQEAPEEMLEELRALREELDAVLGGF